MEGAMGRITRLLDCRTPEELAMVMKIVEPPERVPDRGSYGPYVLKVALADRTDMLARLPGLARAAKGRQKDRDRGQNSLFDG
jgi:hypothetical protein